MIRPMKAPSKSLRPADLRTLKNFPFYGSRKVDGIRCLIIGGQAMSRKLKPIPNAYIQECLRGLPELDGELLLRCPSDSHVAFERVTSAVMSRDGRPDFRFWVFDCFKNPSDPFEKRYALAQRIVTSLDIPCVRLLEHEVLRTYAELEAYEAESVAEGYEGAMLRTASGPYKQGTGTLKEEFLLKCKRFEDDEAEVIGFEEEMANLNEAKVNALGLAERSSHKAGKAGKATLGKLVCKWGDHVLHVSGFRADVAHEIWDNRERYMGKIATFAYQELTSAGLPRFPQFKGWREDL